MLPLEKQVDYSYYVDLLGATIVGRSSLRELHTSFASFASIFLTLRGLIIQHGI